MNIAFLIVFVVLILILIALACIMFFEIKLEKTFFALYSGILSLIASVCFLGLVQIKLAEARQILLENKACTASDADIVGTEVFRCKGIEKPFTLLAFLFGEVKLPEKPLSVPAYPVGILVEKTP